MSKNFTYTFLWALLFMPFIKLSAQNRPDSGLTATERSAVTLYNRTMGDRLDIYRGPAVMAYTLRSATNPNFRDTADFYEDGAVNYDNRMYYHVPLLYNVERDLVESRKSAAEPYNLLSDRMVSFDMLGRHFIRFVPDASNKIMTTGFYEVLYNGKVEVLARHIKTVQTQATDKSTINVFYPKTTYFLKKGGTYYNVNSEGKLIDALATNEMLLGKSQKKELKAYEKAKTKELEQYVKTSRIDFGDNPARALILITAYYDHLTN